VQLFFSGILSIFLFLMSLSLIFTTEDDWVAIGLGIFLILLSVVIPLFLWTVGNAQIINIDAKKIVKEYELLIKNTSTLEAHQIEGVDIRQGIFARKYNYGLLTISGTGGKKILTPVLDSPEEVAKEIRKINPKLS
jgi:uncharacterized membrane protein YdbT with pleckstrin-like domain